MTPRFEILIPWRDDGDPDRRAAWRFVRARWEALYPDAPIVVGTCPPGPWNVSAALNRALRGSRAETVILTGADVFLSRPTVERAVELARSGWVQVADTHLRITERITRRLLAGPATVRTVSSSAGRRQTARLGWGPIAGPGKVLAALGYDERFVGWGHEDGAFGHAAETILGPPGRAHGTAFMLWHDRAARTGHEHYAANRALAERYAVAAGNVEAMRALLDERPRSLCDFVAMGIRCSLDAGHEPAVPHLIAHG